MTVCSLIVTYNRPVELINCVQSVIRQTKKPKSIIIIDNGSTPSAINELKSKEIFKHSAGHAYEGNVIELVDCIDDIQIKYYYLPLNIGPGKAFELGVCKYLLTSHTFLWLMDDDGQPDSRSLYNLMGHTNQFDFINPLVIDIDDKDQLAFDFRCPKCKQLVHDRVHAVECAVGNSHKNVANPFNGTLLKREVVQTIGLPLGDMFGWGVEAEYQKRAENFGFSVGTVIDALHFHPKSRVQKQQVLFKIKTLNWQDDKKKNYIELRNNFYIWYRYKAKSYVIIMAMAYIWLSLTKLKLRNLHIIIFSIIDGVNGNFKNSRFIEN